MTKQFDQQQQQQQQHQQSRSTTRQSFPSWLLSSTSNSHPLLWPSVMTTQAAIRRASTGTAAATTSSMPPLPPLSHSALNYHVRDGIDDVNEGGDYHSFVIETIDAVLEIIEEDLIDFGHSSHNNQGQGSSATTSYPMQ